MSAQGQRVHSASRRPPTARRRPPARRPRRARAGSCSPNAPPTAYRQGIAEGVDRVADRIAGTERPFTGDHPRRGSRRRSPGSTWTGRSATSPRRSTSSKSVYLRDAVYFHHPRYLAHLNCPVVIPALLGEAVLTAVNSSLDTWDQSAGGTLIERRLIDWTAERIGLGPAADGMFTSGGSQSNLQALLLAREEACLAAGAGAAERSGAAAPAADPHLRGRPLQRPQVRQPARPRPGRRGRRCQPMTGERMSPAALARELDRCRRAGSARDGRRRHRRHHRLRLHRPAAGDRRPVRGGRRLVARRRRVRLRAARLADAPAPARPASSRPTR